MFLSVSEFLSSLVLSPVIYNFSFLTITMLVSFTSNPYFTIFIFLIFWSERLIFVFYLIELKLGKDKVKTQTT